MKTSLVIVSVLLAGVATAFFINDNENQRENNNQWFRIQQTDNTEGLSATDSFIFGQNSGEYQNGNQKFNNPPYGDDSKLNNNWRHRQNNGQNVADVLESNTKWGSGQQSYKNQYPAAIDKSSGLAKKMIEKIASLQKIAMNHGTHLDGSLSVNKNVIKLSEQNFVTFYNTTMKNLDRGYLEYMYINPDRDTVFVQYKFDQIETDGSFKSSVDGAKSGYYTVLLNKVSSNVSSGFANSQYAVVRPARFQYADASVKTSDGSETRALNDALEHRYLRVLQHAVSSEVLNSVNKGMIAQMKNEIGKSPVFHGGADNQNKLYDMKWNENDVSMEMNNIGTRDSRQVQQMFDTCSVYFHRNSENTYKMRHNFTLENLEWVSALTVESAGKRMNTRPIKFEIDEINVQVTVEKPLNQQQSCSLLNADVDVTGLQYAIDKNTAQSELVDIVESKLEYFIERSLENYIQEYLKQEICNRHY